MDGTLHEQIQLNGVLDSLENIDGELSVPDGVSGEITVPKTINGTTDYEKLRNKPSIESVVLIGNKTFDDLGMSAIDADDLISILK